MLLKQKHHFCYTILGEKDQFQAWNPPWMHVLEAILVCVAILMHTHVFWLFASHSKNWLPPEVYNTTNLHMYDMTIWNKLKCTWFHYYLHRMHTCNCKRVGNLIFTELTTGRVTLRNVAKNLKFALAQDVSTLALASGFVLISIPAVRE